MRVYAVVSNLVHCTIEVFPTGREADEFLAEVRQDEPELAEMLDVEEINVWEMDTI